MKVVLDIKGEPKKDDLLIYNGKEWCFISKSALLSELVSIKEQIELTKKELANYRIEVGNTFGRINEKLREHHSVLQEMTKEN